MKFPIVFDSFIKSNEKLSADKLPAGIVGACSNIVFDNPRGKATMRGGFNLINSNETTSNIQKMADTIDEAGTNYILAGGGTKIQKSTGGAWSDVITGLATGYFRYSPYSKQLIVTNGEDAPFVLSGAGWATNNPLQIVAPDTSSMVIQKVTTAYGDLDAISNYYYCVVYKDDVGNISNPSIAIKAGIIGTFDTNETEKAFYLTSIPVSSDSRVTRKVIYRTEGNGSIFYKLAEIDNDRTEFEDTLADTELDFSEVPLFVRCPDTAQHIINHGNRIFLANISVTEKFFIIGDKVTALKGSNSTAPSGKTYADDSSTFGAIENTGNDTDGLLMGKYYQWMVTYIDADGLESDPIYSKVYFTTDDEVPNTFAVIETVVNTFGLLNIPSGRRWADTSEPHPQILYRRLYRSKGQNSTFTSGSVDYFLHTQTGGALGDWDTDSHFNALIDDVNDNDLGAIYVPPVPTEFPSGVSFSRVGRPATFYLEDIRQVYDDDGDPINGMVDDGNGVVFLKKRNMAKIYTNGASENWYLRRHFNDVGCDDPKSLTTIGAFSFFRHNRRVYVMPAGSAPQDIGDDIQPTLDSYPITVNAGATNEWVIFIVQTTGVNRLMIIYDMVTQGWYKFTIESTVSDVLTKIYDLTNYTRGFFYTAYGTKLLKYDKNTHTEDYTGATVGVAVSIALPVIQVDGGSLFKLRSIIPNFLRRGTAGITYSVYDFTTTTLLVIYDDDDTDSGIKKIPLNISPSDKISIVIGGGLRRLNNFKSFARPVRRGIGG